MRKLILMSLLMLLTTTWMSGANEYTFSSKTDVVYYGATEPRVLPLTNENGESPENITYTVPAYNNVVESIDSQTGIITFPDYNTNNAHWGDVQITAKFKNPHTNREETKSYYLTVKDPKYGEYRKIKEIGEVDDNGHYMLMNRIPTDGISFSNKKYYYLAYTKKGSSLSRQTYSLFARSAENDDNIYSVSLQDFASTSQLSCKFQLCKISDDDSTNKYSLKCMDITNSDQNKYVSYPNTTDKTGALILSDNSVPMTVDLNDSGILMKYDCPEGVIIGADNSSNFKALNKQTQYFGLYKYYDYEAPAAPTVKIDGIDVTKEEHNMNKNSALVELKAANENIIVYYTWIPEISEYNVAKVVPETGKVTRYTESLLINSAGTLTYYSEQCGLKSDLKELKITKNNPTTSITDIIDVDDKGAIYYTLDGQKLTEKPSKAGVYVVLEGGKSKTMIIK